MGLRIKTKETNQKKKGCGRKAAKKERFGLHSKTRTRSRHNWMEKRMYRWKENRQERLRGFDTRRGQRENSKGIFLKRIKKMKTSKKFGGEKDRRTAEGCERGPLQSGE